MKRARVNCAAVAIGEKIHILGGDFPPERSSYEMFDLDQPNPVSQDLPPMPTERFGFAAVVYDSTNIIALGGAKSKQNLTTVEIFDTIKCEWTQLPSMSTARNNFAAGVAGNSIIVAGGDNTNTCEILDMQTKTWRYASSMNRKERLSCSDQSVVIGNSITDDLRMIVVGQKDITEVYTFKNDSWTSLPDFKSKTKFEKFVKMNDTLVAGHGRGLKTLDLTAPNLISKLVHFVVEIKVL